MKANNKDYQFLKVIREYVLAHGYAPTVRELTKLSGYASTSTIHSRLQRLFFLGFLETDVEDYDGIPRAYRVKGLKVVEEYSYDEKGVPHVHLNATATMLKDFIDLTKATDALTIPAEVREM